MTMCRIIEEPCVVKVTRTVLKTSGIGDSLAEFNNLPVTSAESPEGVLPPANMRSEYRPPRDGKPDKTSLPKN